MTLSITSNSCVCVCVCVHPLGVSIYSIRSPVSKVTFTFSCPIRMLFLSFSHWMACPGSLPPASDGCQHSMSAVPLASPPPAWNLLPGVQPPPLSLSEAWWSAACRCHPGFMVSLLCHLWKVINLSVFQPPGLYRGVVTMPLCLPAGLSGSVCAGQPGTKSPLSTCGLLLSPW